MTDPLVSLGTLWTLYPDERPALADLARRIARRRAAEEDAEGVAEIEKWLRERGA